MIECSQTQRATNFHDTYLVHEDMTKYFEALKSYISKSEFSIQNYPALRYHFVKTIGA